MKLHRPFGKRRRRAVIRLRHALAAEKFTRWSVNRGIVHAKPFRDVPVTWHRWHKLGCP